MEKLITKLIVSGVMIAWVVQAIYYRFFADSSVTCDVYDDGYEDSSALFVHEAGFIGDGYTQIENIVPTFLEFGDLVAVHYDGRLGRSASKFDTVLVARKSARFISDEMKAHGYENLVFFCSSMGGKLSHMTSKVLCDEYGIKPDDIKVILTDAPYTARDLSPFHKRAIPVLAALPYIPFLGTLMSIPGLRMLLMLALAPPPNKKLVAQLSVDEKRAFLNSVKEARKVKPFFASGQAAAIIKPMQTSYPNPWLEGNVVFLRSEKDGMTMPSARASWERFLGYPLVEFVAEGADHCEYGTRPDAYRKVLPEVFGYLNV